MNYNDEIWDTPSHLRRRTLTRAYLLGFVILTLFFATLGIQYIQLQSSKTTVMLEEMQVSASTLVHGRSKDETDDLEVVGTEEREGEMNMIEQAIAKITAQQTDETSMAYMVGEHLKDICRRNPKDAELIFHDLDVEEMSINHAEKQISAYADEQWKSGKSVCVTLKVADGILRSFYGLSDLQPGIEIRYDARAASTIDDFPTIEQGKAVSVSLDDFF